MDWGEGFGDVADYPKLTGLPAIKASKLEAVLAAPVQLPVHKKRKHKAAAAAAPEAAAAPTVTLLPDKRTPAAQPSSSVPDLSGFVLHPSTGKPRVRFADADDEQPVAAKQQQQQQHQQQQEVSVENKGKKGKSRQPSTSAAARLVAGSKRKQPDGEGNGVEPAVPAAARKRSKSQPGHAAQADHGVQQQQQQQQQEHAEPQHDRQQEQSASGKKAGKKQRLAGKEPTQQSEDRTPAAQAAPEAKLKHNKQQNNKPEPHSHGSEQRKQQQQQSDRSAMPGRVGPGQPAQPAAGPQQAAQQAATKAPAKGGKANKAAGGLLDKMRAQLAAGRFRSLNEQLYTCSGGDAYQMMQEDPTLFQHYHDGFQQQTEGWPQQPLELAAKWLSSRPSDLVVVDFGCGEGRLATTVKQHVHSFDLVSAAPHVVACNMAHVPLEAACADVAVFSLALMGTDYGAFLAEAARVLRHKGWLWIAEVRSRFAKEDSSAGKKDGKEDLKPFLHCLAQLGFSVVSLDTLSNTMFFVAVLRKLNVPTASTDKISWPPLKACVYKKR